MLVVQPIFISLQNICKLLHSVYLMCADALWLDHHSIQFYITNIYIHAYQTSPLRS